MRTMDEVLDDLKPHVTEYLKTGDRTMDFMLAITGWMLCMSQTEDEQVSFYQKDLLERWKKKMSPEAQKFIEEYDRLIHADKN